MKKNLLYLVLFIVAAVIYGCCKDAKHAYLRQKADNDIHGIIDRAISKSEIASVSKDEDYYSSKEYQVFNEYHLAVKCPATLKDVSMQSNDDFDFNYAGSTDDTFYQIMIIKIPVGRLGMSIEDEKAFLKQMFGSQGGGKPVLWGEEQLPAYLLDDYVQNGYTGRGIAVARNGRIFAFNVMAKGGLDAKFNSFTNSVQFLDKQDNPTSQTQVLQEKDEVEYQTFNSAGFKIKFHCRLSDNTVFINKAKQQGVNNIIGAYVCTENEDNPNSEVIININVYDHSEEYKNISTDYYATFEGGCLNEYANNLGRVGISYNEVTYQGINALEYKFDQAGLPPAKAIMFYHNKKSYLLQVATRNDLDARFSLLKASFKLIKCNSSSPETTRESRYMKTYTKHGFGAFTISYPQDWELTENPNTVVCLFVRVPIQGNSPKVNYNIIISEDKEDLETKFNRAQKQCKEHIPEYQLLEKEQIMFHGFKGIKGSAKSRMQGVNLRTIIYQLKNSNNITYTITFTVQTEYYNDYIHIFDEIINSFKSI